MHPWHLQIKWHFGNANFILVGKKQNKLTVKTTQIALKLFTHNPIFKNYTQVPATIFFSLSTIPIFFSLITAFALNFAHSYLFRVVNTLTVDRSKRDTSMQLWTKKTAWFDALLSNSSHLHSVSLSVNLDSTFTVDRTRALNKHCPVCACQQ